jgi:hypothetical protein
VLTALFRCPSSVLDITDSSPKICRSYLQLRDQATPYVTPYYNQYLKEYVDRAQPHVDNLNKKFITPAATFAKGQYDVYGAPRVQELQNYAQGTWSSTVKPRLETRRKWAKGEYEKALAPYVQQVTKTGAPYAQRAYGELIDMYERTAIPLAQRAIPYANEAYKQGYHVATDVVFPNVQYASEMALEVLRRQIWPTLVLLYGENVEPQITKITERLGRYKDSKKLQSAVDEVGTSSLSRSVLPPTTSILSSATPSPPSKAATPEPETPSPISSPEPEPDTREKIEHDLENWKKKFAVAAEKGAEDLRLRVGEITSRQIENQAHGTGKAVITNLKETAKSRIETLKQNIIKIVKEIPDDADQKTEDSYYEKIVQEVRIAGSAIKEKAQAVREWETKYDGDTTALINAALESTLKIVDSIRDLGLQQIGMRWANIESVTYEDWSSYHDLKSEFDEWRVGVEDAALKHEGLIEARTEGDHVREAAMKEAQLAVAELVRLRDASKWKIAAKDATDDFASKAVPPRRKGGAAANGPRAPVISKVYDGAFDAADSLSDAIESATASIADVFDDGFGAAESIASEASLTFDAATAKLKPSSTGSAESLAAAASSSAASVAYNVKSGAGSVVSAAKFKTQQVSSAIIGTPPPVASQASSSIASAYSKGSSAIVPPPPPAASQASSSIASAYDAASSAIAPPPPVASQASSSIASAASQASSIVIGTPEPAASQASSSVSSAYDSLLSQASVNSDSVSSVIADSASTASSKVFGGVMAADLKTKRVPIFDSGFTFDDDDDESISEKISSYVAAAGEKGADLTNAVNEALKGLYATPTQGTVERVTSVAGAKVAEALTKASEALYGTTPGAVESGSSVVGNKYAQAVTAYVFPIHFVSLVVGSLKWSMAAEALMCVI